mmetsp:Transcript_5024/g.20521  ORF Transcript_5024/g.20521 Transcript_5024/m.20521 type:complete len:208 (+) Transcript_5024:716-1339(+)
MSESPVSAHIAAITSVVLPAPLESEHPSSLLSPTTAHTPRSRSGYVTASVKAPYPSTSTLRIDSCTGELLALPPPPPMDLALVPSTSAAATFAATSSSTDFPSSTTSAGKSTAFAYAAYRPEGPRDSAFGIRGGDVVVSYAISTAIPAARARSIRVGGLLAGFFVSSSGPVSSVPSGFVRARDGRVHRITSPALAPSGTSPSSPATT